MLLRSSSTPIPHSLFSSDSPIRDSTTTTNHHNTPKLSIHLPKLRSSSCNSSPNSNFSSGYSAFSPKTIQRAQSDSNLQGLSSIPFNREDFPTSKTPAGLNKQKRTTMLRTEPSFSIYNEDGDLATEVEKGRTGSGNFSFGSFRDARNMGLIEEVDDEEGKEESLVSGIKNLGIGGSDGGPGGGGGADLKKPTTFDESGDVEENYKRMVAQDPSNALFLRNYAQFLQSKGDLYGAEEYYFRATLADPTDGEIMLQYAKLVWELHHDQDRALSYYETAARAAPEDSHVLAAYASFLWEIDDNEDEDIMDDDHPQKKSGFELEERPVSPQLHLAAGHGVDVAGTVSSSNGTGESPNFGGDVEDYYKRKLKEDPSNPLFLRNYAQFLSQSKGDLQGAELYYSRAMLVDPGDGEVISQYAKLVWECHHDQNKASYYFERSVQAAPGDSYVLAAYAKFLWEVGDEEYSGKLDDYKLPAFHGLTSAHA